MRDQVELLQTEADRAWEREDARRRYRRDRPVTRREVRTRPARGHHPSRCTMASVDMVALGALQPGTVVRARVPFFDGRGDKVRPAVVVAVEGRTVTLRGITSSSARTRRAHRFDELLEITAAGLQRPSGVSRATVVVDRLEILELLGALHEVDEEILDLRAVAPWWAPVSAAA